MMVAAMAPPILPRMIAQGVLASWFSWPCSGEGESVAPGAPVVELGIGADEACSDPEDEVGELTDCMGGNERDNVLDPGAREVVAKLGAAAAARAGSKRAADGQLPYEIKMRSFTVPCAPDKWR
jgi:hypothetical protein